MRGALVLTLILVGSIVLAGCSSKSDSTDTVSGTGTKTTTTKTNTITTTNTHTTTVTNTSTLPANVPPMLALKVTENGTVTNFTFIGGSLTFDASASMDPDADGLSGIALTVKDSNRTYPTGVLYANGKFSPVTYKFDRAGPVNVTVSGIDNRGDLSSLSTHVYIDQISAPVKSIAFAVGIAGGYKADKCVGPSGQSGPDNSVYGKVPVEANKLTTFIVATIVATNNAAGTAVKGNIALCDPAGVAISGNSATSVTSNVGTVFTTPAGGASYNVGIVGDSSNPPNTAVTVQWVTHYEPQPAAPAA